MTKTLAIERLEFLCNVIPSLLLEIEPLQFSAKPDRNKWSYKEIIGHLIDSATNNHQRFIRGQFEDRPSLATIKTNGMNAITINK